MLCKKIAQQVFACWRHDRLRMELDAFDRIGAMAQAHNQPVHRPGCNLQFFREGGVLDDEAMIAIGFKWLWQAVEETFALVIDQRGLAMHWLRRSNNAPSIDLPNGLMPQADTQHGNVWAKALDNLAGETCFVRGTRPRRYDNLIWLHGSDLIQRHLVVAAHLDLSP